MGGARISMYAFAIDLKPRGTICHAIGKRTHFIELGLQVAMSTSRTHLFRGHARGRRYHERGGRGHG